MSPRTTLGFPLRSVKLTGELLSRGERVDAFTESLERASVDSGIRTLKASPGRGVYVSDAEGVVLKLRQPRLRDVFRPHLFRSEYAGYQHVLAMGFALPDSVQLIHARDAQGASVHGIALSQVTGRTLLRVLQDRTDSDEAALNRIAETLAGMTLGVAKAGMMHRDFKPSNIMIPDNADARPVLIDPQGVRQRRFYETEQDVIDRMSFALCVEAIGIKCGLPKPAVRTYLTKLTAESGDSTALSRRVFERLRKHGDPAPKRGVL